jgi:hypothetical protein
VWQPSYTALLTPDDALGVLLGVDAVLEVLLPNTRQMEWSDS